MGFEPTICGSNQTEPYGSPGSTTTPPIIDWQKFNEYLTQTVGLRTRQEYVRNVRLYWRVLTTGDASPLLGLSDSKRRHAMASLAALSNFTGVKQRWKGIVSNYRLRWNGRNDLRDLVGLLYANRFDEMVRELKSSLEVVPEKYGNYFRFNVLTGLRPAEAVKAVRMLQTNPEYFNKGLWLLEHFRYPRDFIRNTKKAFISVVDADTLEIARATRSVDYQGIRSEFRRRNLPFHMAYCRKIFATFMRRHVDTELVDMLQGRVPASIFAKHYNRPNNLEALEKVRASLPELRKLLC